MTEIRIDRVSHHYGSHAALTDVRARVAPGRVTCLLGPNGAGKSTLVHCIVGLITPTGGDVSVDGYLAGSRDACETIGFVYDDLPLPVNLTGREALDLLQSAHRRWDTDLVERLTILLGLTDALDRLVAPSVLSHLITEYARAGTVLIATHDLLRAQQMADDVLVVDGGRLVGSGPLEQVLDGETDLAVRYLGLTGLDAVVQRTKADIASLHLVGSLVPQ